MLEISWRNLETIRVFHSKNKPLLPHWRGLLLSSSVHWSTIEGFFGDRVLRGTRRSEDKETEKYSSIVDISYFALSNVSISILKSCLDLWLFVFMKTLWVNLLLHWNLEFVIIWICLLRRWLLQNKLFLIPFEVRVRCLLDSFHIIFFFNV